MKKFIILLLFVPFFTIAQTDTSKANTRLRNSATGKNIFKINLSSIALGNYSVAYERQISKKISFSVGFRYMPKNTIPFASNFQDAAGINSDINFILFQMGNTAITPEFRFYAHKNMRGFYISPYARYANFDVALPVTFTTTQSTQTIKQDAIFNGKINSFSGGILFGTQHNLSKHIVLDIWIIGVHFGNSNGNLLATFTPPLSNAPAPTGYKNQVQSLQQTIDGIDASPFKISGKVNVDAGSQTASTATINTDGPWYGIRGLGFNVGIRF